MTVIPKAAAKCFCSTQPSSVFSFIYVIELGYKFKSSDFDFSLEAVKERF